MPRSRYASVIVLRLELKDNEVVHEVVLLEGVIKVRVRDIEQGLDGFVYLLIGKRRQTALGLARRFRALVRMHRK